MLVLLLSCMPLSDDGDWSDETLLSPTITQFSWECIEEDALWNFDVLSAGWTANGTLWLLDTEEHLEEHPLSSIGAASDQSQDHLQLALPIVGDWRDAQKGKSTRFLCEESADLSMLVQIYHPKTRAESDCVYVGSGWDTESDPDCENPWSE
ncbi:MAG: hypothetical protein VX278_19345 [Myxococcota bacterium]|nr:hypothetical protein [Myxococcota bacterium]